MFELDKNLMMIIIENLPVDGMSISALSRKLREKGMKIHRLELSGYLKALADLQILREKDIKPSKVFLPSNLKRKDVYETIGEIIQKEDGSEKASIALYCLCRLFKRPIFEKELRMCGFNETPSSRKVSKLEIMEARNAATKASLNIPTGDKALVSREDHSSIYEKIISELLLEMAGLRSFASDTKQKTLEEG